VQSRHVGAMAPLSGSTTEAAHRELRPIRRGPLPEDEPATGRDLPFVSIRHHQKGTQVSHTTSSAKTSFLRTVVQTLRGVVGGGGGSGAGFLNGTALLRLAALVALMAAALFALTVGSASALTTRQLEGQITEAAGAPFGEPDGLTTDASDRLWAVDRALHAVDRFAAGGAFETQTTGNGAWGEGDIRSLAFSAAAGEVFVADSTHCALWGLDAATGAPSGRELRPFGATEPCGGMSVAADNSAGATGGDLYVADNSRVVRIEAATGAPDDFTAGPGAPGNEIAGLFSFISGALAVAPDGDFYLGGEAASGGDRIDRFAPTGELIGEITEAAGQPLAFPAALAVDPRSEDLLTADNAGQIFEFTSADAYPRQIAKPGGSEFQGLTGLATGSTGRLYVSEASAQPPTIDVFGPVVTLPDVVTGPAVVNSTTSVTLEGEVNPAGLPVTECFFEYGTTTAYGQTAECEPDAAALGEGEAFVPVHADLTGLTAGAVYHYRLVASNAEGTNSESGDREVVTGAGIDSTSVSEVTATTAKLETEINPHGLETTYSFRYGTTTAYGSQTPLPPAPLGEGTAEVSRSSAISGLEPSTTYHFQVIATNALGTVEGPDLTFTTQPASSSTELPDGRGWELVSPADKQGIPLGPITLEGGLIQAAADGHAITYYALGAIVPEPAGNRSFSNSQDLSTRAASGGWSTTDITPPRQAPTTLFVGRNSEYLLFSADLSLAAVEPSGATPLSPETGERTPYLRGPGGEYTPLVYPGNVPAGTRFGGEEEGLGVFNFGVVFHTATPDFSHLILESPTLVPGEAVGQTATRVLYEWSSGILTPVSYVPSGASVRCEGPACELSAGQVGNSSFQVRNAISTDGSRVVFSNGGLYLRDLTRGETLQLDAAEEGCAGCGSGGATFQYASSDDSRVFFTDAERLTADSTAANGQPDLYECHVEETPGGLACDLTDVTANALHPNEPANVQGAVIGGAEDGSSVYFVANGALTAGEGAVSGDCLFGGGVGTGQCNLYRYDAVTSSLSLVAVLSGADYPDWSRQAPDNLAKLTARVSPNGRWFAFMSERPLTGYDNRDAASGERDEEVFLYDATANQLTCASCNPTGARPAGRQGPPNVPSALVDGTFNWKNRWYAANVPGWTNIGNQNAPYQSRYLSDSGRLFFNSSDALVPQDANGTEDVYEFEPPSVGGCSQGSQSFAPRNGGCVSLISSGTSPEESAFMDASESGDDVFFLTASRLTAKDEDKALDLYDARVGGGEAAPVKPVECLGDACQQPATPPTDATPGSLTFNGPGNVRQCPKGKRLKGGKCVRHHKARKKHHKRHRSHAKRRANSNRGGHK
jgi:hypothetical protein